VRRAASAPNQFARDSLVLIDSPPMQRLRNVLCGKIFLNDRDRDLTPALATKPQHLTRIFLHACHTDVNLMLRLKSPIPSVFFARAIFLADDAHRSVH
jgi:hypothetical protein